MKTKKCLLFVRASTNHQEVESQLKETREYAESLGYNEFVVLGNKGFSAYKVSNEYKVLIDEMKETILKDPKIEAVVCYHLNRLFRNITVANELKDWFVENKIQLEIREPHIKLFEPDGTLSNGSEMVFYFFSVYSKQQIDELKAKSKRGKARNKALHKIQGGAIPFGYTVDENKFIVPDPVQAPILSEIFDLYATGEYAYPELAEEINARYGTNIEKHSIYNYLHRKLYYDESYYPPIITEAQFKACEEERKKSAAKPSVYKHYTFANRLIKCPKCGKGYTATERKYICHKLNHCGSPTISTANLDGLLWLIASHLESERLAHTNTKEQLLAEKAVLSQKIDGVAQYLTKGEKRAQRAKKMALDGLIEIEEYKAILKEVEADQKETNKKVEHWRQQMADIDRMIKEDTLSIKKILEISGRITSMNEMEMRTIVRRWVRQITFDGDIWTIETLTRTYKAVYNCYGFPSRWKTVNGNFLAVRPLKRDKDECEFQPIKLKPTELPYTLAFLKGSEIV